MAEPTPQEERHATEDRFYACQDSSHNVVLHTRDGLLEWVQLTPQDERISLKDLSQAFDAVGYTLAHAAKPAVHDERPATHTEETPAVHAEAPVRRRGAGRSND